MLDNVIELDQKYDISFNLSSDSDPTNATTKGLDLNKGQEGASIKLSWQPSIWKEMAIIDELLAVSYG